MNDENNKTNNNDSTKNNMSDNNVSNNDNPTKPIQDKEKLETTKETTEHSANSESTKSSEGSESKAENNGNTSSEGSENNTHKKTNNNKINNKNITESTTENTAEKTKKKEKKKMKRPSVTFKKGGFIENLRLFISIPISLGVVLILFISYFVTQFHSLKNEQVTTWDAPMGIIFLIVMCVCSIGVFIYVSLYVNLTLKKKERKPLYKRIWYFVLIIITFLGIVLSLILNAI